MTRPVPAPVEDVQQRAGQLLEQLRALWRDTDRPAGAPLPQPQPAEWPALLAGLRDAGYARPFLRELARLRVADQLTLVAFPGLASVHACWHNLTCYPPRRRLPALYAAATAYDGHPRDEVFTALAELTPAQLAAFFGRTGTLLAQGITNGSLPAALLGARLTAPSR